MIETVATYGPARVPGQRVEAWLRDRPEGWAVSETLATGALKARAIDCPPGLSGISVERPFRTPEGVGEGTYVVMAEGNLTSLLCGPESKHLTLRAGMVAPALSILLDLVQRLCPVASCDPEDYRVTRVDPSATWRLAPEDAAVRLQAAREALNLEISGRRTTTMHGVQTVTHRVNKRESWTAYDKSAETLATSKGSGREVDLGSGTLLRLEGRYRGPLARKTFGDNVIVLGDRGVEMARKRLDDKTSLLTAIGRQISVAAVMRTLIKAGASPTEAGRLSGPALLLAEGGIPALTAMGYPISVAYRTRARLRELDLEVREQGVKLDVDQVAFVDELPLAL